MGSRRNLALLALAAVVCGGSFAALAQPSVPNAPPAPKQRPDEGALSEQERVRRAVPVATVGEVKITVGDVEDSINAQSPFLRTRYRNPERLREFVQNMVRFELLAHKAEEKGYGDDPAVVRARKQNGVQQLIRREFDEKITPDTVPEQDVREYYEANRDKYHRPEMIRAAHILLDSEDEANDILEQAKEADASELGKLARKHSTDTETRMRGGDLRFFSREGRPPGSQDAPVDDAIVEAAFELEEVGDVVEAPVKVGDHWSIIMLTGRREEERRSLEEVEPEIRRTLRRKLRKQAIEGFVDELRGRFKPEVFEERMEPIQLDPSPQGMAPGFPEQKQGGDDAEQGEADDEPKPSH